MFWKFNLLTSSHIETLLDKEDVTLRELMEEDDILQECKAQNRKLIDFLVLPENMEEMVKLITVDPPDDMDEKLRFKYPNTACELLTSDVSQINDKLAGEENLVDKLYAFLEGEKPLNPLLASFFSKVMGLLITRKSEMIFEYLKSKNDFVGRLLYHIGTSAVMDLLLRLITCIESPETRRDVIEWLNEEKIVEKLVDSIVVDRDEDIHCNAAQSLCDIVRLGREQFIQQQDTSEPDPLLVTMEQEETVSQLLSNMFDSEKNESVLVNGLCVIHTLLEVRRQGSDLSEQLPNGDPDRITQGINNVIAAIVPRLKDFHDLLVNPPKQRYSMMPSSVGQLEPPLGNTRLQVAKLITALVGANMHQVNLELAALGTIQTLLDLYFRYEWNNFLHTQVEQCLLIILNNGPIEIDGKHEHPLLTKLFAEYNLVQRLLQEWEENEQKQRAPAGRRRGYMGHLTKIANSISGLVEKNESPSLVKDQFSGLSDECKEKWEAFVSGALAEVNKRNTIESMRGNPLATSSEDDDTDFKDIPFPQDTAIQQAFSDYQLQQMTSNFIDQFGFNDEEFAEQDDKIEAAFSDRISSIDSDIHVSEQSSTTLFIQACNERIPQFDNEDSDEDIWEEKPIVFNKNAQHARSERLQAETARCNSSDEDSTDSGEEIDSPVKIVQQPTEGMDTSESPWSADSSSEPVAMDTTSEPWEKVVSSAPTSSQQENWADFSNVPTQSGNQDNWADFSCFSDIQSSNDQGPRSSSPVEMDTTELSRGNAYVVMSNSSEERKGDTPSTLSVTVTLPAASQSSDLQVTDLESEESSQQPDSTSPNLQATDDTTTDAGQPLPDSSPADSQTSSPKQSGPSPVDSQVSSTSSDSGSGSCKASLGEAEQTGEAGAASESVAVSPGSSQGSSVDGESSPRPTTTSTSTTSSSSAVSTDSSISTSTSGSDSSQPTLGTGQDGQRQTELVEDEGDDDLGANFSFLAASGLLKTSPVAAACPVNRPVTEGQQNGPLTPPSSPPPAAVAPPSLSPAPPLPMTDGDAASSEPDTTEGALTPAQKLEQARAQAKEAQELYDSATAVMHNGPV
ncbi:serine/threonine-protein phosphatase 6 regulatory subunit 3 isoform X2 [Aplysia californica]|uniref:Serine/threonine-protein phosphatase 6 regulatory subunit 3 isoform X2 n=1 Tax=Aplysia californica TaxID=6500 RepID=A0ABM0JJ19_APLCA|nr:serine/threonine-protein phosphatase 6 regulatory subunit 3 isoform X2 [Aplysia californica]